MRSAFSLNICKCVCVLIITHVVIENHVALLVRVRERNGFSEALEPHHIARVVSPAQTLEFLRRDILGIRVLRTRNEWREMYTERTQNVEGFGGQEAQVYESATSMTMTAIHLMALREREHENEISV